MLLSILTLAVYILFLFIVYYSLRYMWELIPLCGLEKRAIFITGCDTGFGFYLAEKCARQGMPVFAGCLTEQGMQGIATAAQTARGKLIPVQIDVRDDKSVQKAAEFVKEHLQPDCKLWALVNNAGIFTVCGPDDWCQLSDYQLAFDVNTLGVVRVTRAFKPMIKESKGRIITTTSICGRISYFGGAPYSASKYAAEAYMDTIRLELKPFGVKCCILEPGTFSTPLLDENAHTKRIDVNWNQLTPEQKAEYGETYKQAYCESMSRLLMGAEKRIDFVVDNYFHAITALIPRLRYRCGYDALFFHVPLTYLPTELQDFISYDVLNWLTGFPLTGKSMKMGAK